MRIPKVLVGLIIIVYILFAVFGFMGMDFISYTLDSLIIPLIAICYLIFTKRKSLYFLLFIITYAISDLIALIVVNIPDSSNLSYIKEIDFYIGNVLYILAYFFLFIEVVRKIDIPEILKNYKIHLIVLIALNIWLVYVLQLIVVPKLYASNDYYLELIYNIVMLSLLAGALLNYFCRDNQKSLYLFLGTICIVFSEVIDVAYIYISERTLLNFLSTTLSVAAFYFFYIQTEFRDIKKKELRLF